MVASFYTGTSTDTGHMDCKACYGRGVIIAPQPQPYPAPLPASEWKPLTEPLSRTVKNGIPLIDLASMTRQPVRLGKGRR